MSAAGQRKKPKKPAVDKKRQKAAPLPAKPAAAQFGLTGCRPAISTTRDLGSIGDKGSGPGGIKHYITPGSALDLALNDKGIFLAVSYDSAA